VKDSTTDTDMAIEIKNKIQFWQARIRSGPVGEFFIWWSDELKQLLPESWQARLRLATRRLILQFDAQSMLLGLEENHEVRSLETFPLEQDGELGKKQLKALLDRDELNELPRFLALDSQRILVKELKLPVAAEGNLQQVLSFEMDRQTPFRASEVYFDWRNLPPGSEPGEIRLELVVAPRKFVDPLLENLAGRGLGPAGIDVMQAGRTLGVNLLPAQLRQQSMNSRSRLNYGLAAATAFLLVAVMMQSLGARTDRIEKLEQAIAEVQDEARRVQKLREQLDDTSEAASFLTRRRAESPLAVEIVAEVTTTLPDGTYLDRLVLGKDTVIMQGKSNKAQQLIELVNRSSMFAEAGFQGSTRLDNSSGLEIFEISTMVSVEKAE
jgi:general secretion pathway protein L